MADAISASIDDGAHHSIGTTNDQRFFLQAMFRGDQPSTYRDRLYGLGDSKPRWKLLHRLLQLLFATRRSSPFFRSFFRLGTIRYQLCGSIRSLGLDELRVRKKVALLLGSMRALRHARHHGMHVLCQGETPRCGRFGNWRDDVGLGYRLSVDRRVSLARMLTTNAYIVLTADRLCSTVCYSLVGEIPSRQLLVKTVALGRNAYNVVGIVCSVLTPYM
jgi:hypothetical protein